MRINMFVVITTDIPALLRVMLLPLLIWKIEMTININECNTVPVQNWHGYRLLILLNQFLV